MPAAWTAFNAQLQDIIDHRLADMTASYNESVDRINLTWSAAQVSETCDHVGEGTKNTLEQFKTEVGPLQEKSLAAMKMAAFERQVQNIIDLGKRSKLNQFDELATLYNRGLLNKILRPIVDKAS